MNAWQQVTEANGAEAGEAEEGALQQAPVLQLLVEDGAAADVGADQRQAQGHGHALPLRVLVLVVHQEVLPRVTGRRLRREVERVVALQFHHLLLGVQLQAAVQAVLLGRYVPHPKRKY